MAIKTEIYPIIIKIKPNTDLGISKDNISIDLEGSSVNIYNDRGGTLTVDSDRLRLFKDNDNLLFGYSWDTNDDRFNIQDHYLFEFLISINCVMDSTNTQNLKLLYTTTKLLESNNRI